MNANEALMQDVVSVPVSLGPAPALIQLEAGPRLTIQELQDRIAFIERIKREVMKVGTDYGLVPGIEKPSLLLPGAEILRDAFRLTAKAKATLTLLVPPHREYHVTGAFRDSAGKVVATAEGTCSTLEARYRWRTASRKCPTCGKEAIIEGNPKFSDGRPGYEHGGWLCFGKKGGCGQKWPDDSEIISSQSVGKCENEDIADQYNTVLQIAMKRFFVSGLKNATSCSAVFTVNVEELLPQEEDTSREATQPRWGRGQVRARSNDGILHNWRGLNREEWHRLTEDERSKYGDITIQLGKELLGVAKERGVGGEEEILQGISRVAGQELKQWGVLCLWQLPSDLAAEAKRQISP